MEYVTSLGSITIPKLVTDNVEKKNYGVKKKKGVMYKA